jgi:hypothetical protein
MNALIEELKNSLDVEELKIKEETYVLQMPDGTFRLGWDEDEKKIQVSLNIGEKVVLATSSRSINDLTDSDIYTEGENQ